MERGHHQAYDQQPGVALLHLLQQLRAGHNSLHHYRPHGHDTPDPETEPADEGNVPDSAGHEEDPGALSQGQGPRAAGDHAPLQGEGREPPELSGPDGHPDAHLYRAVLGLARNAAIDPREAGRPVQAPLLMDSSGPPGRATGRRLHWDGPGRIRRGKSSSLQFAASRAGGGLNVGDAEDDDRGARDAPAGVNQPADAVDDAPDVRLLHAEFREWAGAILDSIQPHRHCHSRLYYRLGTPGVGGQIRQGVSGQTAIERRRTEPGIGALGRGGSHR